MKILAIIFLVLGLIVIGLQTLKTFVKPKPVGDCVAINGVLACDQAPYEESAVKVSPWLIASAASWIVALFVFIKKKYGMSVIFSLLIVLFFYLSRYFSSSLLPLRL